MPISSRLAGCLLAMLLAATTRAATPANTPLELTFPSSKSYPDPFNDLTLDLLITTPTHATLRLPAFWAGGQTWRARFASPTPGHYTYATESSDPANPSLHHQSGSFDITPYTGDNPLYQHGPIRVGPDHAHFEHADHAPFFWLADTWWMALCNRLPFEGFGRLAADRQSKGFTVVQIVAGLYPDMPAFDPRGANESGFPWTEHYERINPSYFDAADRRIAELVDHGLAPCLVGAWGYHLPWLGIDRMKQHWRYLVARYGAYPCFWCVAGEAAMPYYLSKDRDHDVAFQKQGWTEIAKYVRSIDPYHHPITLHPTDRTRTNITDPAAIDFEMLQTGHGDWSSAPNTLAQLAASRADKPAMPTVNAEVCYEGILNTCHDDVVRFMAYASLFHGTAGHTYGANGIWQINTKEKAYGLSPHGGTYGPTPWDEAMNLPGSRQVGLLKQLLVSHDFPHLTSHPEYASYATKDDDLWSHPALGHWIWFPEPTGDPAHDAPAEKRYFRKTFTLDAQPTAAALWIAADDRFTAYVNGTRAASLGGSSTLHLLDVTPLLRPGTNTFAIEAENLPAPVPANPAGLVASLRLRLPNGNELTIPSDPTWQTAKDLTDPNWTTSTFDDRSWPPARDLGPYGRAPWNTLSPPPTYGPFTLASPATRLTYALSRAPLTLTHLDPHATYTPQSFDPTTGTTTGLPPLHVAPDGTASLPRPATSSNDYLLIITPAK